MNLSIERTSVNWTPELQRYISKKLQEAAGSCLSSLSPPRVIVSLVGESASDNERRHTAEVRVYLKRRNIAVRAGDADLHAAIDQAAAQFGYEVGDYVARLQSRKLRQ